MKKLIPYLLFAGAIGCLAVVFYIDTLDMTRAAYQLPRLCIFLMLALSVMMIAERFTLIRKGTTPLASPPSDAATADPEIPAPVEEETSLLRAGVFVCALIVYILTIKPIGYFIATPVFLFGILSFLRATRMHWAALISIGFTVFVYLLFVLFLNLPVPMGILALD